MLNHLKVAALAIPVTVASSLFTAQSVSATPIAPTIALPAGLPDLGLGVDSNKVPIVFNVGENNPSLDINGITITNNNNYDVNLGWSFLLSWVSGDKSDVVTGVSRMLDPNGGSCVIGPNNFTKNATCTLNLKLTLPNEIDYGDFGLSKITVNAFVLLGDSGSPSSSLVFDVKVHDVPEPSSLALLVLSILGIGFLAFRRRTV